MAWGLTGLKNPDLPVCPGNCHAAIIERDGAVKPLDRAVLNRALMIDLTIAEIEL